MCVDASSLVPEKLLKRGHNNEGVVCFLVRYKGFDEDLDDWVPISDLPIRLVDEFYCSPLNMETPHFDLDVDEYDGTNVTVTVISRMMVTTPPSYPCPKKQSKLNSEPSDAIEHHESRTTQFNLVLLQVNVY